ncbi:hypothetical protein MARINON1_51161 [Marinobacter salarius]|nr:hypothetical protein MBHK15_130449 [Marinobacter salarius]VXB72947.1 hypothetical protein MARINON1_51161 [Marinobacter salarius]
MPAIIRQVSQQGGYGKLQFHSTYGGNYKFFAMKLKHNGHNGNCLTKVAVQISRFD